MTGRNDIEECAAAWLVRRDQPEWSATDDKALKGWLAQSDAHKVAFWRLEAGWEATARLAAMRNVAVEQPPLYRLRESRPLQALAASFILICLFAAAIVPEWVRSNQPPPLRRFTTTVGEHRAVHLPDGSAVTLNTASVMRTAVNSGQRAVWLDRGEAYFDVAHDTNHPFVIHAGDRVVTVLGTRFSVRRDGGMVTVAVVEGRVRVEDAAGGERGRAAVITAGNVAISRGTSMLLTDRSPARAEAALSWRRGMLTFDRTTLGEAAAEFNRYNRRQIRIADQQAAEIRIGGTFEATDVDAFARLLHAGFGLAVREDGNVITINS
ncbi:FecR domain-containing protein [Sphingomonas sp.]|uniref:FecR family protein n=1 Tax=Sphingomonas sp. TaxID=28214 RepID=UPI0031D437C0